MFDVSNVTPNYKDLQEVSLFLVQNGALDSSLALGLYISIGGAEWQYRGYVSSSHPSEVMPLSWPEQDQPIAVGPGTIQLGISLEPQGVIRCMRTLLKELPWQLCHALQNHLLILHGSLRDHLHMLSWSQNVELKS